METDRDDVKSLQRDEEMEQVYYVMLSLCREYSIDMMQNPDHKEECLQKLRQIKNDMKYLERTALVKKVNTYYLPLLKQMSQKHYNIQ